MGLTHRIFLVVLLFFLVGKSNAADPVGAPTIVYHMEEESFARTSSVGELDSLITIFFLKDNPFFLAAHRYNRTNPLSLMPVDYDIAGSIDIEKTGKYSFGTIMQTPPLLLECMDCNNPRSRSVRHGKLSCFSRITVNGKTLIDEQYHVTLYPEGYFRTRQDEYDADNEKAAMCRGKFVDYGHIRLEPGNYRFNAQVGCFGRRNFRYPHENPSEHIYRDGCGNTLHPSFATKTPANEVQIHLMMRTPGQHEPEEMDLNKIRVVYPK